MRISIVCIVPAGVVLKLSPQGLSHWVAMALGRRATCMSRKPLYIRPQRNAFAFVASALWVLWIR